MDKDKEIREFHEKTREQQRILENNINNQLQRIIDYLIVLSIGAIGYIFKLTHLEKLSYIQIILLFSIIFFSISIYYGYSYKRKSLVLEKINYDYLNLYDKPLKELRDRSYKLLKEIEKVGIVIVQYWRKTFISFIAGIIFFFIWHIFQMIFNTVCG